MQLAGLDERLKLRKSLYAALLALFVIYFVKFAVVPAAQHAVLKPHGPVSTATYTPIAALASVSTGAHNIKIKDKVAVIIEDRHRFNLIPLVLHFSVVLGPDWPIIIYTSRENVGLFTSSAPLGRSMRAGIISIRILPPSVLFTTSDSVSRFLTKPWLWNDLAPAKHILMFQADSMLCANSAGRVEDFFAYDFVGAPISAAHGGKGMNGGLSLRKRETMLRVVHEFDWETNKGSRYEDRWYFDRITELAQRDEQAGVKPPIIVLPDLETSRTFSVESINFPHPLGVHQVHRFTGPQPYLDEWCPEHKLCSNDYIKDDIQPPKPQPGH